MVAGALAPPTKIGLAHEFGLPIEADKYYSVFLVDSLQKPDRLVLNDTLSLPSRGKAKVRVLNLSFNAGPIDMYFVSKREGIPLDNRIFLAQNLPYKTNPGYIEVPAGLYDVQVRRAGSSNFFNLSTANLPARTYAFDSSSVYTIWFNGLIRRDLLTPRVLPDDNSNPRYNIVRTGSYPQSTAIKNASPDIYMIANRWRVPR